MEPKTNAELDKSVLNLMKIIGSLETGGESNPYSSVGDKHLVGGSHGKFQYRPDTWKERAGKYLGDPKAPLTPANQNKVTYLTIKDWKDKGLSPQEIDARWNGATLKNGKYVHNAKDREAKFINAFNAVASQAKPIAPVSSEPKYGFNQETESEQMSRLQSQKQLKDQADITERQGREGVVENVLGGVKDFGKGIENSATRMGGNLLTFGNEALQKAGFKGSQNPVLNYGTEANKFATGDATAGNNLFQKAGGFVGDVAQVVAPVPGAGKVTAALKGTDIMRKLAGMGGAGASLGSKVLGFGARALPVALEGSAAGAQADILTTGDVGLGSTIGYGALNVGTNKLLSALGRKSGVVKDVVKELDDAISSGNTKRINELKDSQEMKNFLFSKGLTDDAKIAQASQNEVNTVRQLLSEAGSAEKGYNLSNLPEDDIKAFLEIHQPGIKETNGQLSYVNSWRNAEKQKKEIGSQLGKVTQALASDSTSPLNNISLDEIENIARSLAVQNKTSFRASNQLEVDKAIAKEIAILRSQLKGKKPNFETIDGLRIAGNERSYDISDAGNAKDVASRFLADAVRQKTDDVLNTLIQNAEKSGLVDEVNAIKHFQELNKAYGSLTGAQDVIKGLEKVPKTQQNRLTTLLGATLATGGGYNPIAFVAGSFATDKMVQAFKKAQALGMTPNQISKMTKVPLQKTNDIINQLKTKKLPAGSKLKTLPDPRSLRDILLNTPR